MRKRRRSSNYKFTEKTHSVRGAVGVALATLSILSGAAMVVISFLSKGNGTVYLGSGGILCLLVSVIAFVLAIRSIREEDTYKGIPTMAMILGTIALLGWLLVYAMGFMGI